MFGRLFGRQRQQPAAVSGESPASPLAWTQAAYSAMNEHFTVANGAMFREHAPPTPRDRRFAYVWPFGQAFAATLAVAALPDGDEVLGRARLLAQSLFEHYWDARQNPPGAASYPMTDGGGTLYYDDNCWLGLDLADLYDATKDPTALADATRIWTFVINGWDDDDRHPAPGGIFWMYQAGANPVRDRNTISNAPAAQLGLRLYLATGEQEYLDRARECYAWAERTLRDPADGLYWDHIKFDGTIERTKWSYNQGMMLGAATLLARATGDDTYLARARQLADAALDFYTAEDRLWQQDPPFNAIFFRNLRLLGDDDRSHSLLTTYAARAWTSGRDPRTGLFHFGRRSPVNLLYQAAAVQIFALLASAPLAPQFCGE
jgi:hypothetical protein